jgi:hypothetical protein
MSEVFASRARSTAALSWRGMENGRDLSWERTHPSKQLQFAQLENAKKDSQKSP